MYIINNNIKLIFLIFFICSCSRKARTNKEYQITVDQINNRDTIELLDLSNKGFKKVPDLSSYNIKRLDLSKNDIKKFDETFLPKSLLNLNLSKNLIGDFVTVTKLRNLRDLDLSFNNIDSVNINPCIKNVDLSNNNLVYLNFDCFNEKIADTLDISNNTGFSNVVPFPTTLYNIVLRKNIKNKKSLIWSFEVPIDD